MKLSSQEDPQQTQYSSGNCAAVRTERMARYFSPKEVARAIGVSESSLKRWVDKGFVKATKTAGGHRRIELDAVIDYVRRTGKVLAQPETVELPAGCGTESSMAPADAMAALREALTKGDEDTSCSVVLNLYISGMSIAEIADQIIAPVFHEVGELWHCGEVEVYQERRACEICLRIVHELRRAVGQGEASGPVAIGGTLDGDPYTLATSLAELVLRSNGWQASSMGNMLPFEAVRKALHDSQPALLWVSVSSIRDADRFAAEFNLLYDVAQSTGTAVVVGGQALSSDLRQRIRYTHFSDNFQHMEAFARTVRPATTTPIRQPAFQHEPSETGG